MIDLDEAEWLVAFPPLLRSSFAILGFMRIPTDRALRYGLLATDFLVSRRLASSAPGIGTVGADVTFFMAFLANALGTISPDMARLLTFAADKRPSSGLGAVFNHVARHMAAATFRGIAG